MSDIELPAAYQDRDDADELKERYREMLFEPGEAIGTVGAQSLAEPATQMTMETYHSAGAAKVSITLGLPRLIEIIDARKNPKTPIMNVHLEEEMQTEDGAREVAAEIQAVTFQDVVDRDSFDMSTLELEFQINENVVSEFRIDMDDIEQKLKEKLKKTVVERDGKTIRAYPDTDDYDLTDLQDLKKKATGIRLKGLKGIEHLVLVEENDEWYIQTAGVNLRKVLKIDGVDATRTTTNDFFETRKVLGIEAARAMILRELQNTLDEQGMNVDVRWLILIADTMTKHGTIEGTTRYGLVGAKHSVLARSAFEETKSHLTGAALHGEVDPLNSVIENLIVGQVVPVGTGQIDLKAEPGKAEPVEEPSVPMHVEIPEDVDADDYDYEALVEETVDVVKDAVTEQELDPVKVLMAEAANKNRATLVNWLETRIPDADLVDYAELASENIADIKEAVAEQDLHLDELLEAERENKDRQTLVTWLEERIAEDEADDEESE